jgi:2-amino-4-hydroxy-6-hydroxymethyldihydropteridine diphosphokinase
MASSARYFYVLAFGSNLGDRAANVARGREMLMSFGTIANQSQLEETIPLSSSEFDTSDHGAYINGVMEFVSELDPRSLYAEIRVIEDRVGHRRDRRWAPRELDVDVIFCARGIETSENFATGIPLRYVGADGFVVPHRSFLERKFLEKLMVSDLGISTQVIADHLLLGECAR